MTRFNLTFGLLALLILCSSSCLRIAPPDIDYDPDIIKAITSIVIEHEEITLIKECDQRKCLLINEQEIRLKYLADCEFVQNSSELEMNCETFKSLVQLFNQSSFIQMEKKSNYLLFIAGGAFGDLFGVLVEIDGAIALDGLDLDNGRIIRDYQEIADGVFSIYGS